ncbi:MAG: YciI family protein [Candidatus Hodarchaeota archaeon]
MTRYDAYMVVIKGRPNFPNTMAEEEEKIMKNHFEYLKRLLVQDKLIMAGPTLDDSGGYIILNTTSEDIAQDIMSKDPSVSSGIMKPIFHPFRVSLINCPQKNKEEKSRE